MWPNLELALCFEVIVVTALAYGHAGGDERPIVRIGQGPLRGLRATDGDYDMFLGIPYATVPEDKFKGPLPPVTWDDIRDADVANITCVQGSLVDNSMSGSEHCLVLNVYTPRGGADDKPLPVLVWIHGGAFYMGSGGLSEFGPKYLIRHGIVIVTVNYRLGAYGFLCLKTEKAPGNAGLKDQVSALRWVQKNIAKFGGDPNNVTLAGQSAGGVSVEHLMLSPMTAGLFHRVIAESGSALTHWAIDRQPMESAKFVVGVLGNKTDDLNEIASIFQNAETADVVRASMSSGYKGDSLPFAPCIEDPLDNVEAFLREAPFSILKSGNYNKVPILTGFNSKEGFITLMLMKGNDKYLDKIDKNFIDYVPSDLVFANDTDRQNTLKLIKKSYFGDQPISNKTLDGYIDYYGDVSFNWSIYRFLKIYSQTAKSYFYEFCYDGGLNVFKKLVGIDLPGASHSDELGYLFSDTYLRNSGDEDKLIVEQMTTLWSNFIKYGDPTPETTPLLPVKWPAYTVDSKNCLVIDRKMKLEHSPRAAQIAVLDAIYEDHYVYNQTDLI